MATLLLKKSYHINLTNETEFRDLWDDHGVFTTMRLVGNPLKIIFFKEHIKNLINSTKKYLSLDHYVTKNLIMKSW